MGIHPLIYAFADQLRQNHHFPPTNTYFAGKKISAIFFSLRARGTVYPFILA